MKQEVLAFFPMTSLTLVGLIIFFTMFMGILWWVFNRTRVPLYDHLSHLPLQEDS